MIWPCSEMASTVQVAIYSDKCQQLANLGNHPFNIARWNPQVSDGHLLLVCAGMSMAFSKHSLTLSWCIGLESCSGRIREFARRDGIP